MGFHKHGGINPPKSPFGKGVLSESINLENKVNEEEVENLHPPMYHITRLERLAEGGCKCYPVFVLIMNILDLLIDTSKRFRFPKPTMMFFPS
jgi:hypothetical protein